MSMSEPSNEAPAHHLQAQIIKLQQDLASVQALYRILEAASTALDLIPALERICTELAQVYQVPQVAMAVFDEDRATLTVIAEYLAAGRPSGLGEQIAVAGNPIMAYILAEQRPMVIADTARDQRLPPPLRELMQRRQTASLMVVPVWIGDILAGTIGIDAIEARTFDEADMQFAMTAALAVSRSLEQTRLHSAIQHELAERRRAEAIIAQQHASLAELSTPLIPLGNQLLVLPLIGAVDDRRAQQIMENLLAGVAQHHARAVIIDITGLPLIDTHVAAILVRTAQAIALIGAETILTGIRPEVAQTLVSLGVDMRAIRSFSSLERAIAALLHRS